MLAKGWLPKAIAMLLVILLPKPDGGLRPIGLFATITRVLMHWLRNTAGSKWLESISRAYCFGSRGRTIERCTWASSAAAEYAKARGEQAAT
eukprot:5542741-Heterocapsa_arctica.AAC.1